MYEQHSFALCLSNSYDLLIIIKRLSNWTEQTVCGFQSYLVFVRSICERAYPLIYKQKKKEMILKCFRFLFESIYLRHTNICLPVYFCSLAAGQCLGQFVNVSIETTTDYKTHKKYLAEDLECYKIKMILKYICLALFPLRLNALQCS